MLIWSLIGSATCVLAVGTGIWCTKSSSMSQGPPTIKAQSTALKISEPFPKNGSIVQVPAPLPATAPRKAEPVPKTANAAPEPEEIRDRPSSAANSKVATATPKDAAPPTKDETIQSLVPGNPPLTQDFLDQLTGYAEWLLDIQLTEPQRHEWQQLFLNGWKNADQGAKDSFLVYAEAQFKWIKEIAKLTGDAQ